jgi:peptide deformylase
VSKRQTREEERDEQRRVAAQAQIRQFPDPVLKQPARAVTAFDEDVEALASRMITLMHDAHGAGLAAPQIGLLRRVFVYVTPDGDELAVINPQLVDESDEVLADSEGCLSLALLIDAGVSVPVDRHVRVRLRGFDPAGEPFERDVEGHEARVIQHELDHLDGVLILDRTTIEARRDAMRLLRGALT